VDPAEPSPPLPQVSYTLDRPGDKWGGKGKYSGFINEDMIKEALPPVQYPKP